ncbi:hypothetical protein ACIBCS_36280 [Streptomyces phaeochromogenes]|uniref:hypothetical protein n=1 Tax=Streptomyces phaeochromogenes TaxID=1923 RepID=UPI0033D7FF84
MFFHNRQGYAPVLMESGCWTNDDPAAFGDRDAPQLSARVPPLLIIDSPLAGLGSTGLDQETSVRLMDTLISIADAPSSDGYACQVIAATNDPLPRADPSVQEIHIDDEQRFFDHAPVHTS